MTVKELIEAWDDLDNYPLHLELCPLYGYKNPDTRFDKQYVYGIQDIPQKFWNKEVVKFIILGWDYMKIRYND